MKIKHNLEKRLTMRLTEQDYKNLKGIFERRCPTDQLKYRNLTELIRYAILSFIEMERRRQTPYQTNYFNN